jgi:tetratricopeptide (TPR) repeat protein
MNSSRRLGLIVAMALTMDAFIIAPAFPQQDEAAALDKRVGELVRTGKFSEAVPLAQRALEIWEQALGPDHFNVATVLHSLAALDKRVGELYRTDEFSEAVPLAQRALEIWEKALGPDHPDVATALNGLAELYREQGRYADLRSLRQIDAEYAPELELHLVMDNYGTHNTDHVGAGLRRCWALSSSITFILSAKCWCSATATSNFSSQRRSPPTWTAASQVQGLSPRILGSRDSPSSGCRSSTRSWIARLSVPIPWRMRRQRPRTASRTRK